MTVCGLFSSVSDAVVKNLTINGADISSDSGYMGTLVGWSSENCIYEYINISNSIVEGYNSAIGGVVGFAEGEHEFYNVDVDSDSLISAMWGSYNAALGGIVGSVSGELTVLFESCDVACKIDAYNDITSAYPFGLYRRCGMLLGDTSEYNTEINGSGYEQEVASANYITAINCSVTYGDWVNYTYCQFNGWSNYPCVRVQSSRTMNAYSNARTGTAIDVNGEEVKDDNHVHSEGECHNFPLTFNQLFRRRRRCTWS